MQIIHFISNYFISPDYRYNEIKKLDDGSGIELSWGMNKSFSDIISYTNWLTSLIKLSNEIGLNPIKTAKLMRQRTIKRFGLPDEDDYIDILLDSVKKEIMD